MHRARKGHIIVLLAPGFEESDVTTVTRTLRRAGFSVVLVGLTAGPLRGAYGLSLAPDGTLSEVETDQPQAVVLPGGIQGARRLVAEPRVHDLLRQVINRGGYLVALDMGYLALRSAGVLSGPDKSTGGSSTQLHERSPLLNAEQDPFLRRVTVEGQVILGRDAGTAHEAAMTLVALIEQDQRSRLSL